MKTKSIDWNIWATQKEFASIEGATKHSVGMWVKRGKVTTMRWECSPNQYKTLIKKGSLIINENHHKRINK